MIVQSPQIIGSPLILRPQYPEQVIIRDVIIDGEGERAVDIEYPEAASVIQPTVYMQNVTVRGRWTQPWRLKNCWNARLIDCNAIFHSASVGEQQQPLTAAATIGFDLQNSMDVQLIRPMVNGYDTSIRVYDSNLGGEGEGLHIHGGWLMNTNTGIKFEGFGSGGWMTPHVVIDGGIHIAHNQYGIFGQKYSGVQITNANIYGQFWSQWPVGIYLEDCWNIKLGNHHWFNRFPPDLPPVGTGIILSRCRDATLVGNTVDGKLAGSLVVTADCQRIHVGDTNRFIPPVFRLDGGL